MTRPTALPPDIAALERQIELINRFPDQNPNPVMRMSGDGLLIYANESSAPIRSAWQVSVGDQLPPETHTALLAAAETGGGATVTVESGLRTFAVLPVPVPEFGFVNLYGTDITAATVVARFPDRNPNPVFRVSEDGVILYLNIASRPLMWTLGCSIGEALPPEVHAQIRAALDGSGPASFEALGEGRTYLLLPVRIAEFNFINVYGTDITAQKAINRFPDQNPNPVMRVSRDGVLTYANPASQPIVDSLEAAVGERVRPEFWAEIDRRVEAASLETIELEAQGRLFSILVVALYEFSAINLYGTDITAARMVEQANRENERLLLNILPAPVADRLHAGEQVIADRFDDLTLLFADIVDFTVMSSRMSPTEVVDLLNDVFSLFDALVEQHRLEKIKTIGDAYMVVGGLEADPEDHTVRVAEMALDLMAAVERVKRRDSGGINVRVGIHRGPAVAGVIGVKKFIYDVWGDTVNTASRMESHSVPGRIQVTDSVMRRLQGRFALEPRGTVDVKGKGPMSTWFLTGRTSRPPAGSPQRALRRSIRPGDPGRSS
jgi:class 3 adenylate cyclase